VALGGDESTGECPRGVRGTKRSKRAWLWSVAVGVFSGTGKVGWRMEGKCYSACLVETSPDAPSTASLVQRQKGERSGSREEGAQLLTDECVERGLHFCVEDGVVAGAVIV